MRSIIVSENETARVFVVALEKGEEVLTTLTRAARDHQLRTCQITGVGAFERATVGYLERPRRAYRRIELDEQLEVLSFAGNVMHKDNEPLVHVHVALGRADGSTIGGHLFEARVWPTLELVVTELPGLVEKVPDAETGLPLVAGSAG